MPRFFGDSIVVIKVMQKGNIQKCKFIYNFFRVQNKFYKILKSILVGIPI